MAQWLKQSTQVNVHIGPFVDVGDGFTPETGVTLAAADEAEILKHGATTTTDISGNTMTAIANCDGWYYLTLTTTDTNTLGCLEVIIHDDSVCLPVYAKFMVVPANVYDSLVAGSDYLQADAVQIEGADPTDTINAQVDAALDTAIPGAPTANSINERLKAIDDKLPSKSYLAGSNNSDGDIELDEATGSASVNVAQWNGESVGKISSSIKTA